MATFRDVCVVGTASGISIICIGSIVERTKGFKLIGILRVSTTAEYLANEQCRDPPRRVH